MEIERLLKLWNVNFCAPDRRPSETPKTLSTGKFPNALTLLQSFLLCLTKTIFTRSISLLSALSLLLMITCSTPISLDMKERWNKSLTEQKRKLFSVQSTPKIAKFSKSFRFGISLLYHLITNHDADIYSERQPLSAVSEPPCSVKWIKWTYRHLDNC